MLFATAEVGTGFPSAVLHSSEGNQAARISEHSRSTRVQPKLFWILTTLAAKLDRINRAGGDGIDPVSTLQPHHLYPPPTFLDKKQQT